MIIDMHAHILPDAIYERAYRTLSSNYGVPLAAPGSLEGIGASMKEAGVDISLILPVATRPGQFEHINAFAAKIDKLPGIRSYGGIHPHNEDIGKKLDLIRSSGLLGVKLHPDYQQEDIDSPGFWEILQGCKDRGLYVTVHAGFDPACPDHVHCPAERSARVIEKLYRGDSNRKIFLTLAHLGSNMQYDDAEKYLVGLPVYFDLAYSFGRISDEQLLRIIRKHGADKIVFGTDSPWYSQKQAVEKLKALPLTTEEYELIAYKNAQKILFPGE